MQVLLSKLSDLDAFIHRLLSLEEQLSSSASSSSHRPTEDDAIASSLALLVRKLVQGVWPALAVLGGMDSGFCIGRSCISEGTGEGVEAVIVSIPDSDQNVVVEKRVVSKTEPKLKKYVDNTLIL